MKKDDDEELKKAQKAFDRTLNAFLITLAIFAVAIIAMVVEAMAK